MEDHHLLHNHSLTNPLLPRVLRTRSAPPRLILRLAFLSFLFALAVWATVEDSRGFRLTVVNALPVDSPESQRFDLFFVSNGLAERILLNATDFVENILLFRKTLSHVTLKFGGGVFPDGVLVEEEKGEFVVELSSDLMDDVAVKSAVLRGVARVWVWDSENVIRGEILSGVVEYIVTAAGFGSADQSEGATVAGSGEVIECGRLYRGDLRGWFVGKDSRYVARILGRCEEEERGFIGRLIVAMRDGLRDRTV